MDNSFYDLGRIKVEGAPCRTLTAQVHFRCPQSKPCFISGAFNDFKGIAFFSAIVLGHYLLPFFFSET
ncbi:MAG: hypothetical protein ACKPKO_25830, partial [Candidatus Fonsibacter sp.]